MRTFIFPVDELVEGLFKTVINFYSAVVIMSLKLQDSMVYWEILMQTLAILRLVLDGY